MKQFTSIVFILLGFYNIQAQQVFTLPPTVSVESYSNTSGGGSIKGVSDLPVELLSFSADCDGTQTLLRWQTASETNNDYFIVEQSFDALNFTPVTKLQGNGTSAKTVSYSFSLATRTSQTTYYRLKQVDIDGKISTFEPIALLCPNSEITETTVKLFPVPFTDKLTISTNGQPITQVLIYDVTGKQLHQEQDLGLGTTLDLHSLSKGVYIAHIYLAEGKRLTNKIIKK